MKKVSIFLILIILILGCIVMIFKNSAIKSFAEKLVAENTSFTMHISDLDVSLLKHKIALRGITLDNPADYPESEAIVINELLINFDPISALSDNFHIYQATLDIARIVVVQKADGENNIERLVSDINGTTQQTEETPTPGKNTDDQTPPTRTPEQPARKKTYADEESQKGFLIDTLTLRFGEAEYLEYEEGKTEPENQVLKLNRERRYTDITSFSQVAVYITTEVVLNQGLRELNKWAKDNKESLGIKDEEIDQASKIVGGILDALQKK